MYIKCIKHHTCEAGIYKLFRIKANKRKTYEQNSNVVFVSCRTLQYKPIPVNFKHVYGGCILIFNFILYYGE